MSDQLLKAGIAGSVLATLCCATPILVLALGAVGLSAYAAKLDYVLIPLLVFFLLLTLYAWSRRRPGNAEGAACCTPDTRSPVKGTEQ